MFERATLNVLARAAEIGLLETATTPAAVYDPFLRPFIKKRVLRAVASATARTHKVTGDHVLRLAFLGEHTGAPANLDADDERAVAAAFDVLAAPLLPPKAAATPARSGGAYRVGAPEREVGEAYETPPRPKRQFWPVTTSILVTTVTTALGVGALLAAPYFTTTPVEKFARTPFGAAAGEPLASYVANGSADGDFAARDEARQKLMAKSVEKQIGREAMASLGHVLDALPRASNSAVESTDDAIAPLAVALNDFDRRLVDAHVPALVHVYASGQLGRRSVWLTSYFVEQRAEVTIDAQPFRVAWGRRLDDLNLADSPLYKGMLEDWAILSLAHMEEELVEEILSPLAFEKPMSHGLYDATDASANELRIELARRGSELVTSEVMSATHVTREEARALSLALAARNDALVGLAKSGWSVAATPRMHLSHSAVARLQHATERGGYEAKRAREALREDDRVKRLARPLMPLLREIASIEEEVFLGRLAEEKRLKEVAPPAPLSDDVGADPDGTARDDAAPKLLYWAQARRERAIAAADLSSIARARATPRLALWLLVRQAASQRRSRNDTGPTALVLGELFGQLGLGTWKKLAVDDDFLRLAAAALAMPPDRVRLAAAAAYADVFGRPVPLLSRRVFP